MVETRLVLHINLRSAINISTDSSCQTLGPLYSPWPRESGTQPPYDLSSLIHVGKENGPGQPLVLGSLTEVS
jgi:hypothetical protein